MIQKVLRCTLGILFLYCKQARPAGLACLLFHGVGVEEKCSCVSSSSPMVSHAGGGAAGVQLVGDLIGAVIESIVIHALVDVHAPQDDTGVIAVLQDHLL